MAVAAIEPVEADVMLVAEGNGLRVDGLLPGDIGRPGDRKASPNEKRGRGREPKQYDAQGRVCVRME